jgi:N-acetylmuramoyl-L-alanine amidase
VQITTREQWGANPPTRPLTPADWKDDRYLWAHHTVGNYVKPDYGDDAKWLRVLKRPAAYPAHLVAKVRFLASRNAAVKKQTIEAEMAAMREIQRFHQRTRGWSDIGYAFVVFPSGRVYEGRGRYVGAHCPGHNAEPSCAFAGDYTRNPPTQRAVASFDALRKQLGMVGWRGHREGFPTACPGAALFGTLMREVPRG